MLYMKDLLNKIQSNKGTVAAVVVLVVSMVGGAILVTEHLQSQAKQTGDNVTEEVSEEIRLSQVIVTNSGEVPAGEIDEIQFDVALSSGTERVDVNEYQISISSSDKSTSIAFTGNSVEYTTNSVLTESNTETTVNINLSRTQFGTLSESDELVITLTPDDGTAQSVTVGTIPGTIEQDTNYVLP